jgi:hypothetical protein
MNRDMNDTAARIAMIAAELNAEAMAAYIEAQGMIAENAHRISCGNSIAYGEEAFIKLRDSLMVSVGNIGERVRNCY